MNVIKATRDFERWIAKQIPLVRSDVALKHRHMAESPFAFFRATFYRWLQLGTKPAKTSPKRRGCWWSAIYTSKTSGLGATRKGG
jgi:hypothetical protein